MAGQIRFEFACACSAPSANPSIPKPGCGITSTSARAAAPSWTRGGRPRPAAFMITPLPGVHTLKPGSASRPFFGVEPVVLRDDGTRMRAERRRQAVHQETVARHHAHHLGRPRPFHQHLFHHVQKHVFHRRRLPRGCRRRLLAAGPRGRRGERLRPSHRHGGSRERAGEPSRRWPKPPSRPCRTTSKARRSTPS